MAVLLTPPFLQFFDENGDPLSNGKVYTYQAGTTTPKATYTNETELVQLANPVILDSAGRAVIWINGSYKFVVTDSADVVIRTVDDVTSFNTLAEATNAFFQSFSGTGAQTSYTLSEDLGTEEKALMVFVSTPAFAQRFSGTGAQTVFTLSQAFGTDEAALYITVGGTYVPTSDYTVSGTTLTFSVAPASASNNVVVVSPSTAPFSILNPNAYTVNGTNLTFATAPVAGTNNILVFAPSTLVGAASAAAAAAAQSEANAAASETAAALSETAAAASAVAAAASATQFSGTSSDSVAIGAGTKVFTTQANKLFNGENVRVYSAANVANFMDGIATYSGTTLSVNVTVVGGSGTFSDWVIKVNGARGATGAAGGPVTDGNYGDITVSSSGTNWQLNAGSVGLTELGSTAYQTGTWTPSITFATPGNLSVVLSNAVGTYTKIGSQVTAHFYITTSTFTHTTASGNLNINGFPFAATNSFHEGVCSFQGITKAGYTSAVGNLINGTTATVVMQGSGQPLSAVTAADMPSGGAVIFLGNITYNT